MEIRIIVNDHINLDAVLNDTETAQKIYESLPIGGKGSTWGKEIYFHTPVAAAPENQKEVLEKGELAYWPPMQAFCIFYGPTPGSRGDEIRAVGPVNVIGKITGGDISKLEKLSGTVAVTVKKK